MMIQRNGKAVMLNPLVLVIGTVWTLSTLPSPAQAFVSSGFPCATRTSLLPKQIVLASSSTDLDDDFASFADSLDQDALKNQQKQKQNKVSSATFPKQENRKSKPVEKSWQADLERLLDPTTSAAERQILFSDLMNANAEIRSSVEAALRERKVRTAKLNLDRILEE
jgi:hypothetical protein